MDYLESYQTLQMFKFGTHTTHIPTHLHRTNTLTNVRRSGIYKIHQMSKLQTVMNVTFLKLVCVVLKIMFIIIFRSIQLEIRAK